MPKIKAKPKIHLSKKGKSIMYCLKNSVREGHGCGECSEKSRCIECGAVDFIDHYSGEPYCIGCAMAKFEKEK